MHESLVDHLGLERYFLPQAKSVTTATQQKVSLSHYVILPLSSEDLEYDALPVQLVMTPSLSYDIILGMLFLRKNSIQIDAANNVVRDSHIGYTLVGYSGEKPQRLRTPYAPPALSPKQKKLERERLDRVELATTHKYRDALLLDIMTCLETKREKLDKDATCECPLKEIAAAILTCLVQVEDEITLEKQRDSILEEFQEVFSDVLHASKLPTDVLAEIRLKESDFMIPTWSYGCPHKFRDA
jgi:hypothetical protein